jgi:hypothetical protein
MFIRRYDEIWDFNYCHKENGKKMHRPGHEGKPIGHFTQVSYLVHLLMQQMVVNLQLPE